MSREGEFKMVEPTGIWLGVFLAVVVFCLVSVVAAVWWTAPRERRGRDTVVAIVVCTAWPFLTSLPIVSGLVTRHNPVPGAPIQVGLLLLLAVLLAASPRGRRVANEVPLWALVGVQGMRLPLELVLHAWAEQGVAPPQMTWTGSNLDILAGLASLALAPFADRSRAAAWASQLIGIVLLANVGRIVVLSLPTPLQQFESPLLLPFMVPSLWIATVCVMFAVTVHLITVRRLVGR